MFHPYREDSSYFRAAIFKSVTVLDFEEKYFLEFLKLI